jgi:flagellar motility protein MotE (MotC chaperone)
MRKSRHGKILAFAVLLASTLPASGNAAQSGAAHEAPVAAISSSAAHVPPPMPPDNYCGNIASFANDARYALQKKTLEELQQQIDQKLAELEATRAENEAFLKKRAEEDKATQKGVADIFAKMKPDVAAAQFEILDVDTSAAILKQLNARAASTILNEMKASVAAAITIKMAEPAGEPKSGNGT